MSRAAPPRPPESAAAADFEAQVTPMLFLNIEYSTVTPEEPTPTKTYSISGSLEVFVTKADCVAGKPAIGGGNWMSMPMDMSSTTLSNPIAESYKYLKTQAVYSAAVDA